MICINPTASKKHLYELGVSKDGQIDRVEVRADSRSQASQIASAAGYMVRDVNMIG